MSHPDIENLLNRYLKKETTPEENEVVEEWLAQNEIRDGAWQKLDQSERDQWLKAVYTDIENSIRKDNAKVVAMHPLKRWRTVAAVAAVIILIVSLFLTSKITPLHAVQLTTVEVPYNQKQQITLADGSNVWVNALSSLRYPTTFNDTTREVYLTGEAYFDISHDASKPFIVHTGKVVTKVLGTAFNIRAMKESNDVVVTVTRGKVSVSDGSRLLAYITPDEQVSYNIKNHQPFKSRVNAADVIAWQSEIRFEDITFENAAKQLQERYKTPIIFDNDKVKSCRFSGTALNGKSLDDILKVICSFNHANYKRQPDGSILINGKGCNQ